VRRHGQQLTDDVSLQVALIAGVQQHQQPPPLPRKHDRRPQRCQGQLQSQLRRQRSQGDRPKLVAVHRRADPRPAAGLLLLLLLLLLLCSCAALRNN
jgi:hypothetical protein